MCKKRFQREEITGKLRHADVLLGQGKKVAVCSGFPGRQPSGMCLRVALFQSVGCPQGGTPGSGGGAGLQHSGDGLCGEGASELGTPHSEWGSMAFGGSRSRGLYD
jgi:hypothetical protein